MGKCLRIVFAIFNSLIFLGGCVLLGLAIWLHVNPESLYEFVDVTADQVNNSKSSAEFEQALEILDASVYFAIAIGTKKAYISAQTNYIFYRSVHDSRRFSRLRWSCLQQ